MALSTQVETALNEAQDKLREALAFAARSEKPYISKHISDMMMKIDCFMLVQLELKIIYM